MLRALLGDIRLERSFLPGLLLVVRNQRLFLSITHGSLSDEPVDNPRGTVIALLIHLSVLSSRVLVCLLADRRLVSGLLWHRPCHLQGVRLKLVFGYLVLPTFVEVDKLSRKHGNFILSEKESHLGVTSQGSF